MRSAENLAPSRGMKRKKAEVPFAIPDPCLPTAEDPRRTAKSEFNEYGQRSEFYFYVCVSANCRKE